MKFSDRNFSNKSLLEKPFFKLLAEILLLFPYIDKAMATEILIILKMTLTSLGINFLRSVFLRGIEAFLLLLMHILLANTLGVENYGVFSYSWFIMSLFAVVAPLGFNTSSLLFVPKYISENSFNLLKGFSIFAISFTFSISIFISLLLYSVSCTIVTNEPMNQSLRWASVLIPLISTILVRRKIAEGSGKVVESVTTDLITPIGIITCCLFTDTISLRKAFIVFFIFSAVSLIVGLYRIIASKVFLWKGKLDISKWRKWIMISFPLLAASLGNVIMNRSDIIILGMSAQMESVGFYTAALKLVALVSFCLNAVYVVVVPKMSSAYSKHDLKLFVDLINSATILVCLGGGVVLFAIVVFPESLLSLFGQGFSGGQKILVILGFSQGIHLLLGLSAIALTIIGKQKQFAYTMIVMIIVNVTGNLIVAPIYGGTGVAYVTLLSTFFLKIWQTLIYRKCICEKRRKMREEDNAGTEGAVGISGNSACSVD